MANFATIITIEGTDGSGNKHKQKNCNNIFKTLEESYSSKFSEL